MRGREISLDVPSRHHVHVSPGTVSEEPRDARSSRSLVSRKRLLGTRDKTLRGRPARSFLFDKRRSLFSFSARVHVECGMGGDAESRACAFQCALDNRNDVTEALFSCVLDKNCMPEM